MNSLILKTTVFTLKLEGFFESAASMASSPSNTLAGPAMHDNHLESTDQI